MIVADSILTLSQTVGHLASQDAAEFMVDWRDDDGSTRPLAAARVTASGAGLELQLKTAALDGSSEFNMAATLPADLWTERQWVSFVTSTTVELIQQATVALLGSTQWAALVERSWEEYDDVGG